MRTDFPTRERGNEMGEPGYDDYLVPFERCWRSVGLMSEKSTQDWRGIESNGRSPESRGVTRDTVPHGLRLTRPQKHRSNEQKEDDSFTNAWTD